MHGYELIELATILAADARLLVQTDASLSDNGLEEYWVASKCRLDRWGLALAAHGDRGPVPGWAATRATIEEIFVCEVATRIWTLICCSRDVQLGCGDREWTSVARNVYAGHLEATARAMRLLTQTDRIGLEQAVALNRVRRRSERWNDLLLGTCGELPLVEQFVHCRKRFLDVAGPADRQQRSVVMAAVQLGCRGAQSSPPANPAANRRVAASLLACLSSHLFGSTGHLLSDFRFRLIQPHRDCVGDPRRMFQTHAVGETEQVDPPGHSTGRHSRF